jgi:DNA polymerase III alpha subunit (gram-positive type)
MDKNFLGTIQKIKMNQVIIPHLPKYFDDLILIQKNDEFDEEYFNSNYKKIMKEDLRLNYVINFENKKKLGICFFN